MDLGLSDRACMVTGASRGIGRAAARALAAEGASVLLLARGGDALAEAAAGCREAGAHAVETLGSDLTEADGGEGVVVSAASGSGGSMCSSTMPGRVRPRPSRSSPTRSGRTSGSSA